MCATNSLGREKHIQYYYSTNSPGEPDYGSPTSAECAPLLNFALPLDWYFFRNLD